MHTKRPIKVWDIFFLHNYFQRKVTDIEGDYIYYHDGIWYWGCLRSTFLSACPRIVKVSTRDMEISRKIAAWKYEIYPIEMTVNWVLDDHKKQ